MRDPLLSGAAVGFPHLALFEMSPTECMVTVTVAAEMIEPGISVLGLAEEGVGWALDENNESLVSAEMAEAVNAAREQIIAGEIAVHNFTADGSCPVAMECLRRAPGPISRLRHRQNGPRHRSLARAIFQ